MKVIARALGYAPLVAGGDNILIPPGRQWDIVPTICEPATEREITEAPERVFEYAGQYLRLPSWTEKVEAA